MDYEREPDSGLDSESSESEASAHTDVSPIAWAQGTADAQRPDSNDEGLGTDADVMDDSFASGPNAPEWPTPDFESTSEADAAEATSDAYTVATAATKDLGDDSDAPVVDDAVAPALSPQMQPHVRAESVNLTQAGAQTIEANTVTLSQGGAAQVRAEQMTVHEGGVALARVSNLKLGSGASAFAVVADEATVEEGSNTFLVVSRTFNGDVRPTVDWRTALAFGAGVGFVLSLFRRRR
ncbi:MAG TPA: hypothetical protein VH371_08780 [Candidatus Limnocylindrales bacterium]